MKQAAFISVIAGTLLLLGGLAGGLLLIPPAPSTALRSPSGTPYIAEALAPRSPLAERLWGEPVAQSSGPNWIFEVFTPPLIFFHEATNAFTLTPPLPVAERPAWDVTLLEVSRPL